MLHVTRKELVCFGINSVFCGCTYDNKESGQGSYYSLERNQIRVRSRAVSKLACVTRARIVSRSQLVQKKCLLRVFIWFRIVFQVFFSCKSCIRKTLDISDVIPP